MNETTLINPPLREAPITTSLAQPFMQLNGLNSLASAAMPLLMLMIKLKQTERVEHHQIFALRRQVIDEIMAFVETARKLQCSPRIILAARYCICTALDEAVLSTNWGNNSIWSHQTLLSIVQKETWGGERFFIILEEMAKSPAENLPLLELLYLILSLGFEGRYYNQEQAIRDEVRHRLFYLISMQRDEPEKALSPSLGILKKEPVTEQGISRLRLTGITLAIFISSWAIFNVATWVSGREILQAFTTVNQQLLERSQTVVKTN